MMKRVADILLSLVATVVLAAPMLLIAAAVRLESPGPAIFRQRRAGWRGRPFVMLKFRSMRSDAEPYGVSPHSGADRRLTRIGRLLRETSLDELPQLLNVLRGDMSLVGPRPLYERQAAEWNDQQRRRLDVRPGLTGYAQAYGRGDLPIEDKIEMDVHYVDHRTFWMDVRIVFRTAWNMIFRRGNDVYEKRYSRDKERETD
jgi:lipopolysaccharide/colanic/teichoic acid biosynthesis glycosyltransferase